MRHLHAIASEIDPPQKLGDYLAAKGHITRDQLQIALHEQKFNRGLLGTTLVRLGFLNETTLAHCLAEREGLEPVDLAHTLLDPALIRKLPRSVAERCKAIPLSLKENILEVAMADPHDLLAIDEIRRHFPRSIKFVPCVAPAQDIANALNDAYGFAGSIDAILHELENNAPASHPTHPIIRLVETLLCDALRLNASDIHLEPEETLVRVRIRVDGVLQNLREIHRTHWPALAQRIKLLANLNIADPRSIQDGRFSYTFDAREIDFRVAIMPAVTGETIVIRILDRKQAFLPLHDLGFSSPAIDSLMRILEKPQGLTLVTGPTGSGKTTTLYSILKRLSSPEVAIATLEEPVEYHLPAIRQTAIAEDQGLSFAEGVRAVLRQDPDILFIGEIRDADTAQMALRAAMTGHQVFATLHCQNVWGAIPRLVDLGLNPAVLMGHISGIVAQRLVRKLCPACKIECRAERDEAEILGFTADTAPLHSVPVGCPSCRQTGRAGRTVIAEILPLTPELEDGLLRGETRLTLLEKARKQGFRSLQQDGIARVLSHDISLTDLRRTIDMMRLYQGD